MTFDEKYATILHKPFDSEWSEAELALQEQCWKDMFAQHGLVEVTQTDLDCDEELEAFVSDVEAAIAFEKSLN